MASQFYSIAEPTPIQGPRISVTKGPQWDRAEVTYLCQGDPESQGGFAENGNFPGAQGFIITDIETESVANNGYLVRLGGQGVKKRRVYSTRNSYSSSQMINDLEIGGVRYSAFKSAWPSVDLMLSECGFRQIIVGAESLLPSSQVGQSVAAPPVGSFPPAPPNPWTSVDKPLLHYPWGWVLARIESETLRDGGYSDAGPWIATYEYVFRWKVTYGG